MKQTMKSLCPGRAIALTAVVTIFIGLGMLVAGMVIAPSGQIHSSVLVAFGEVSTFVCALLGVNKPGKTSQLKTDQNF